MSEVSGFDLAFLTQVATIGRMRAVQGSIRKIGLPPGGIQLAKHDAPGCVLYVLVTLNWVPAATELKFSTEPGASVASSIRGDPTTALDQYWEFILLPGETLAASSPGPVVPVDVATVLFKP